MKACLLIAATYVLLLTQTFAQAKRQPALQAEILRSMTGKGIDAAGFGNIPTPLRKGMIFDVEKHAVGTVILNVDGRKVMVAPGDVRIAEKPAATQAAAVPGAPRGFVPGRILVLSAKYTLAGNQPRNVKNRIQKLIPDGILARPVEILVSDNLSMAAQSQGDGGQSVAVVVTPKVTAVVVQNTLIPKNVLTIEYTFNGQRMVKQALEGTRMVLP
ncbi:MAG: hypothetical protein ACO1TE_04430 [Prosthecobacter sp.]